MSDDDEVKLSPAVEAAILYEVENPFTLAGLSPAEVELIQSGYRQAFLAGARWRSEEDRKAVVSVFGDFEQGILELVNSGDASMSEIYPELKELYFKKQNVLKALT